MNQIFPHLTATRLLVMMAYQMLWLAQDWSAW
jgi:hypothetical protein